MNFGGYSNNPWAWASPVPMMPGPQVPLASQSRVHWSSGTVSMPIPTIPGTSSMYPYNYVPVPPVPGSNAPAHGPVSYCCCPICREDGKSARPPLPTTATRQVSKKREKVIRIQPKQELDIEARMQRTEIEAFRRTLFRPLPLKRLSDGTEVKCPDFTIPGSTYEGDEDDQEVTWCLCEECPTTALFPSDMNVYFQSIWLLESELGARRQRQTQANAKSQSISHF